MPNRYKFVDTPKEHMHYLDSIPLTGTSSVMNVLSKPLSWWASGKACEVLGGFRPRVSLNCALKQPKRHLRW
jgi:hypothetical protein